MQYSIQIYLYKYIYYIYVYILEASILFKPIFNIQLIKIAKSSFENRKPSAEENREILHETYCNELLTFIPVLFILYICGRAMLYEAIKVRT